MKQPLSAALSITKQLAHAIHHQGGQLYYVGGYVRNLFIKEPNLDIDCECYHLTASQIIQILQEHQLVYTHHEQFGIFALKNYLIEIALPRTELKIGPKHSDFKITSNPFLSIAEAIQRRDFTMNALLMNVLSEEIIDITAGQLDIQNKQIRHINASSFLEDDLRALRAAQFSARFDMRIHPETLKLCQQLNLLNLAPQHHTQEWKKGLNQAKNAWQFLSALKAMNQLSIYQIEMLPGKIDSLTTPFISILALLKITNKHFDLALFELTKHEKQAILQFCHQLDIFTQTPQLQCFFNVTNPHDFQAIVQADDLYQQYLILKQKTRLSGQDLIDAGILPSPAFKEYLTFAYELYLQNHDKKTILKQTIQYIKNKSKTD